MDKYFTTCDMYILFLKTNLKESIIFLFLQNVPYLQNWPIIENPIPMVYLEKITFIVIIFL